MPVRMPVRTTRLMYRGICTIPDILSYRTPINLPEDEKTHKKIYTLDMTGRGQKTSDCYLMFVSGTIPQCDMSKLTVDELKRLLYDTFCDHLTMKDIENIIMTEESHLDNQVCQVDIDTSPTQQVKHTCVRKSLICAFAFAFIISVMLIAANQMLRRGMK
uniref:Uncharacterized protein n=1 Tax=Hucho hucho TaxID=62062 RepID=A0A4W5QB59_9TELE